MNIRNVAVAAHVDAGKTTLTEQILYTAGAIRKLGNVKDQTAQMDWHPLEKNRGITIFAEQAAFEWRGVKINLVDTPGHIDFYSELERTLRAVDSLILVISAVDGIQQYTETVLDLAQKYSLPVLFFVNKLDRDTADINQIINDLQKNGGKVIPLQQITREDCLLRIADALHPIRIAYQATGEKSIESWDNQFLQEEVIELLAENDDALLERYLDAIPLEVPELTAIIKDQFKHNLIRPILAGSAAWGAGIEELLNYLVQIMPAPSEQITNLSLTSLTRTSGLIYKVRLDEKDGLLAYVRLFTGELNPRDSILTGENQREQKVKQLRIANGSKCVPAGKLPAGDLGVILGLDQVKAGDFLGDKETAELYLKGKNTAYVLTPVLAVALKAKNLSDQAALIVAVETLLAEDPLLAKDAHTGQNLQLMVMGKVQIEVLSEVLKTRFGLEVEISEPEVQYFETVTGTSTGFCHYEPKKHYAEVEVEISPLARGEGIKYESALNTDNLPLQYQNAIRKAVPEALNHGSLAGRPLRDVQVKLLAGKYHLEHTHGGDFKIATIRAIQQALQNNRSILLEPLNAVFITASQELAGKILADITRMKGSYDEPNIKNGRATITGLLPVATSLNYPLELNSLSSGTARIMQRTGGLQECHNTAEVLEPLRKKEGDEKAGNDKEDILYNSVSLFRQGRKMLKITNT